MEKRAIWHGWAPVSDNSYNYQGVHSELPPEDTTPATPKDITPATTEGHNSSYHQLTKGYNSSYHHLTKGYNSSYHQLTKRYNSSY